MQDRLWELIGFGDREIVKCYYLDKVSGVNTYGGISQTVTQLKSLITPLGEVFEIDSDNINEGYPILKWQV